MKLLIIIIIFYLAYRAFKYWVLTNVFPGPKASTVSETQIDDIMVKDPVCEVYFPKRNGIPLSIDGKILYFCSEECKNKYWGQKS